MHIYGYGDNCYGRGDYYRGDYYRGDPGLLSFVGKAVGTVAKGALGFATGGPLGAVKALLPPPKSGIQVQGPFGTGFSVGSFYPPPPGGGMPQMERAYSAGAYNYASCGPNELRRGRWNKSTYITRGGGTSRWPQQLIVHPKGTECVRPRRMNVCNPRALRRALTRASGFAKIARRYITVSKRFKKGGRRKRK